MKNDIILLSGYQKNWHNSHLFLDSSTIEKNTLPFKLDIQDDLKAFFAPTPSCYENFYKKYDFTQNTKHSKDIYATTVSSNYCLSDTSQADTSQNNNLQAVNFQTKNSYLPAPLFITDTASSSLDVAHFLIKNIKNKNINTLLGNKNSHTIPPFTSILCRNQTQGRGQLRRNWVSPSGNIYAALFLPNISPFSTESAAPALGALLVHALRSLGFLVELKWPNDIIQKKQGKYEKVAGILLEERQNTLVAGIGINIQKAPPSHDLREDFFMEAGTLYNNSNLYKKTISYKNPKKCDKFLKNIHASFTKAYPFINKNINKYNILEINFLQIIPLWCALVEELFLCYKNQIVNQENYQDIDQNSTTIACTLSWQELATKYLAFIGESVRIIHPIIKEFSANDLQKCDKLNYIQGKVCGINQHGELLLQTNNHIVTILGGSFSQEK